MLVKLNKSSVIGFHDHHIVPGINDLPDSLVAKMEDDKIMEAKFESGELEIISIEGVKNKKSGEVDISKISDRDGKVLIDQTVSIELLEKWYEQIKSKILKKAIKMKIAKIKDIKFRDEKSDESESESEEGEE